MIIMIYIYCEISAGKIIFKKNKFYMDEIFKKSHIKKFQKVDNQKKAVSEILKKNKKSKKWSQITYKLVCEQSPKFLEFKEEKISQNNFLNDFYIVQKKFLQKQNNYKLYLLIFIITISCIIVFISIKIFIKILVSGINGIKDLDYQGFVKYLFFKNSSSKVQKRFEKNYNEIIDWFFLCLEYWIQENKISFGYGLCKFFPISKENQILNNDFYIKINDKIFWMTPLINGIKIVKESFRDETNQDDTVVLFHIITFLQKMNGNVSELPNNIRNLLRIKDSSPEDTNDLILKNDPRNTLYSCILEFFTMLYEDSMLCNHLLNIPKIKGKKGYVDGQKIFSTLLPTKMEPIFIKKKSIHILNATREFFLLMNKINKTIEEINRDFKTLTTFNYIEKNLYICIRLLDILFPILENVQIGCGLNNLITHISCMLSYSPKRAEIVRANLKPLLMQEIIVCGVNINKFLSKLLLDGLLDITLLISYIEHLDVKQITTTLNRTEKFLNTSKTKEEMKAVIMAGDSNIQAKYLKQLYEYYPGITNVIANLKNIQAFISNNFNSYFFEPKDSLAPKEYLQYYLRYILRLKQSLKNANFVKFSSFPFEKEFKIFYTQKYKLDFEKNFSNHIILDKDKVYDIFNHYLNAQEEKIKNIIQYIDLNKKNFDLYFQNMLSVKNYFEKNNEKTDSFNVMSLIGKFVDSVLKKETINPSNEALKEYLGSLYSKIPNTNPNINYDQKTKILYSQRFVYDFPSSDKKTDGAGIINLVRSFCKLLGLDYFFVKNFQRKNHFEEEFDTVLKKVQMISIILNLVLKIKGESISEVISGLLGEASGISIIEFGLNYIAKILVNKEMEQACIETSKVFIGPFIYMIFKVIDEIIIDLTKLIQIIVESINKMK